MTEMMQVAPDWFERYQPRDRKNLLALRELILETAASTPGTGGIEESLKWNQPSFATVKPKSGSPVRIDVRNQEGQYALYFVCHTHLVDRFRELYPESFTFEGDRALIFEDGDGNPVHADAFTVGTLLAGAGVRVAVINACRAGAGGGAASSIAGALLRAGVPVVVAMQSAIPDTAAVVFSKTVYESIALGNSVEQATTAGRRAIFALGQVAGASWWIPALFSRSDDPVVLVERSSTGEGDTPTDHLAGAHTVASRNSAISQGGVAISGQVGGSVVVVSTSRT